MNAHPLFPPPSAGRGPRAPRPGPRRSAGDLDLPGIGERPFHWVERLAQRAQGRMVVTHLTIIFGATAMAALEAPLGFLIMFVALKSLLDLGGMLPDRDPQPKVPRAVKALGRRLPKKDGRSLSEHVEVGLEAELARSEANEEVRPPYPIS